MNDYKAKRDSAALILGFMGGLAHRYSAERMSGLWDAMDATVRRFGEVFVADAIRSDRKGAELALVREAWGPGQAEGATNEGTLAEAAHGEARWQRVAPEGEEYGLGFKLATLSLLPITFLVLLLMSGGGIG